MAQQPYSIVVTRSKIKINPYSRNVNHVDNKTVEHRNYIRTNENTYCRGKEKKKEERREPVVKTFMFRCILYFLQLSH